MILKEQQKQKQIFEDLKADLSAKCLASEKELKTFENIIPNYLKNQLINKDNLDKQLNELAYKHQIKMKKLKEMLTKHVNNRQHFQRKTKYRKQSSRFK